MNREKYIELLIKMIQKLDNDDLAYIYYRVLNIYRRRNIK